MVIWDTNIVIIIIIIIIIVVVVIYVRTNRLTIVLVADGPSMTIIVHTHCFLHYALVMIDLRCLAEITSSSTNHRTYCLDWHHSHVMAQIYIYHWPQLFILLCVSLLKRSDFFVSFQFPLALNAQSSQITSVLNRHFSPFLVRLLQFAIIRGALRVIIFLFFWIDSFCLLSPTARCHESQGMHA